MAEAAFIVSGAHVDIVLGQYPKKRGAYSLTPLVKIAPVADCAPDARPVKAEDADTSSFCKALNKQVTPAAKKQLIPQQLGIGVSGGIQITTIGLAMKYEEAKDSRDYVFCAIDIANAHNAFPQRLCLRDSH